MKPTAAVLERSIDATTTNGKALLEDASFLFDWDRFSTAFALAVLAQEEFAKAFLLQLVADEALPWLPEVQRSMARHQCKHLLAIVMDWLPSWDGFDFMGQHKRDTERHERKMAWLQRSIERRRHGLPEPDPSDPEPVEQEIPFPADVAAALNIYRHEQIERMRTGFPWKDEEWSEGAARKVADGWLDRQKQSALYVDITKTGEVGLHPALITKEQAAQAIERAKRVAAIPVVFSDEYRALKEVLPVIFANLNVPDEA